MLTKTIFNEQFKAKTAPLKSFSTLLQNTLHLKADEYLKTLNQSPIALKYVIHHYQEYLVDLSINEVNVHMNGHSKQQLGAVYCEAAKTVLQDSEKFYEHLWNSLGNLTEVRLLVDADVSAMKDLIKSTTVRQLVDMANQLLQNMKQKQCDMEGMKGRLLTSMLAEWKDVFLGQHKQDALIESMMENFRIPVNLPEQTEKLWDISTRANMDKLEKMWDCTESVCDLSELEGYYSEEQLASEEDIEGCPKQEEMEVEDEMLKISSSIDSTKEGDSMGMDSDYETNKRPRQYEIEHQPPLEFKRPRLNPSY